MPHSHYSIAFRAIASLIRMPTSRRDLYFTRYEETTVSTYWKHSKSVTCLCIIKHARENIPYLKVKVPVWSQDSKCLQLSSQLPPESANLTSENGSLDYGNCCTCHSRRVGAAQLTCPLTLKIMFSLQNL